MDGLELDGIERLDELLQLANEKQDFAALAMLHLAGVEEAEIFCADPSKLSQNQKIYLVLSSANGLQALGPKPDLRAEFSGLPLEEILFFLRLIGHSYLEKNRSRVAVLFGSFFNDLNTHCYPRRGIPVHQAIAEKHRVIAELWSKAFQKDAKAVERMERSMLSIDELFVSLRLYGTEILQHEETYPGKSARPALEHFLKNGRGFFFKDAGPQAAQALCDLLVNGCKSPFSIENLAILREKIVQASLSGT